MGDIAVKIKGNHLTCQIGKPKFECKVQGVVIQGGTGGGVTPQTISVVPGTTFQVPAGKLLFYISAVPTNVDRVLSAGYSPGATQVLDNSEIPANDNGGMAILRRYDSATTIHFSGYTGSLIIYLI